MRRFDAAVLADLVDGANAAGWTPPGCEWRVDRGAGGCRVVAVETDGRGSEYAHPHRLAPRDAAAEWIAWLHRRGFGWIARRLDRTLSEMGFVL